MNDPSPHVLTVFAEALDLAPAERAAYLDRAGLDADARARVEALLRAHRDAGQFLGGAAPAPSPAATVDEPIREGPGTVIGPYKLLEQIGEGGMGTVWLAQQTAPVKRLVALKLVKAGMDSKQVIARFEAERQALALMDHANIARVLDGGTTSAGRPYFVMDLVKGVPITRYCDEHHLTPRQRLELFIPVCQAVQHAHQKGIIHRDLKPSNVLVAVYDGKPVPKVIDFGVAKAAGQTLTEKTLVTSIGAIVGTLEYMSPEQAGINQLDIDTRSDIYSLGVLLYELLAGSPPFTRKELEKAGMLEMLRVIREQEPSKPSTKLSTAEGLPTLAANRGTEPAKLTKLVRGELDWIVMKALEKDRSRRYETASGFAMDLQRYLADEPVQACPPSAWYRFRKFTRRHKAGMAVAGLVLFFIVFLGGGVGWTVRERAERRAIVEAEVTGALEEAEKASNRGRFPEALAAVKRAQGLLASAGGRSEMHQRVRQWRADLDLVIALQEASTQAIELDVIGSYVSHRSSILKYEAAFRNYGIDRESTTTEEAALQIRSLPPELQFVLLEVLDRWWVLERNQKKTSRQQQAWLAAVIREADADPWRARMREAASRRAYTALEELASSEAVIKQAPFTLRTLADLLAEGNKRDLGIALLRRAQQVYPGDFMTNFSLGTLLFEGEPPLPEDLVRFFSIAVALNPDNAGARLNLGAALRKLGKLDEAIAEYRKAIELQPEYAVAHHNLGNAFRKQGNLNEAAAAHRQAIALNPDNADAHINLGVTIYQQRNWAAAEAEFRAAIRLKADVAGAHFNLGNTLRMQAKLEEAIGAYRQAIALKSDYREAHFNLGTLLDEMDRRDEAIVALRRAIALDPTNAGPHYSLGIVLQKKDRLDEAIAAYGKVIELKPDYAEAHCDLGLALQRQGRLAEALSALQRGHDLGSKKPGWSFASDQWVQRCQRLIELDRNLAAAMREASVLSREEKIDLGNLCMSKHCYAAAAEFFEKAYAEQIIGNHFRGIRATALAGSGHGEDVVKLNAKGQTRWRHQALAWLRSDLSAWKKQLQSGVPKDRLKAQQMLKNWLSHPDLAGVRDGKAVDELPEMERVAWRQLWAEVEALLKTESGVSK